MTKPGHVVSVIEYSSAGTGRWKTVAIIAGADRRALVERALSAIRMPEVRAGLARRLGPFLEGREEYPHGDRMWYRVTFSLDPLDRLGDGRCADLYFAPCEVLE